MPEACREAAELLQRADPSVETREAQRLQTEGFGAKLSRTLLDRVFDYPHPSLRPGLRSSPLSEATA